MGLDFASGRKDAGACMSVLDEVKYLELAGCEHIRSSERIERYSGCKVLF